MHRTEGTNHVSGLFSNDPPATVVEQNWLNAIQEEIAYVVEQAGLTLETADTETSTQLKLAINLLAAVIAHSTRDSIVLTEMSTAIRDGLPAINGRIINNGDVNQFQGYINGNWINLHGAFD